MPYGMQFVWNGSKIPIRGTTLFGLLYTIFSLKAMMVLYLLQMSIHKYGCIQTQSWLCWLLCQYKRFRSSQCSQSADYFGYNFSDILVMLVTICHICNQMSQVSTSYFLSLLHFHSELAIFYFLGNLITCVSQINSG